MPPRKKNDHPASWLMKSYNNIEFLNSPSARILRVMAEMTEPADRFRRHRVWDTVVFFGSARTLSSRDARRNLSELKKTQKTSGRMPRGLQLRIDRAERDVIMSRYYEEAAELAERLTVWFKSVEESGRKFMICSGGGPGIMEAANRGAKRAKGKSVGLNISLPFEQAPNPYQTRDLSIEFHYFFIRKFWFFYLAKALVVFPGGFGTLDEFFELLTIIQTRKSNKYMPVVLYGSEYWSKVFNIDEMIKWGTISPEDINLFRTIDTVDEAYEYLKGELTEHYVNNSRHPVKRK
ncbi:MAG: LOG family protein [candidate division Zixibacteria bacterium]|nr:LOG family protein [candidate division Zixibacteria bacterium]